MIESIPNFILVDKPAGWTSFDAVNFLRGELKKATGNKKLKVGHAGTLDPFATGLLIVAVGRDNTRKIDEFKNLPKTYLATIKLGATTDTFDSTGQIIENKEAKNVDQKTVENVLNTFLGPQPQLPPMFSAKKINGQRLYKLARQGKKIEREPNEINIYKIKLISFAYPELTIEVECSAGTYIRSLAHDIGERLKTGAYCLNLRRTKIGDFDIQLAKEPKDIKFS